MADKRAYFKLDVGYLMNPKVALVCVESPAAILLHIGSIAYAAQHLTDGVVPVPLLLRLTGATGEDAGLLLKHGLWVARGDAYAEIHDYLEHQRSSADAKGAADKASRAASARWHAPNAEPSMPESIPAGMLKPSAGTMPREKERETQLQGAFDTFWTAYPKKEAKGAAVKAFKAAAKKADPDTITAGLRAQLPELEKRERKFIPLASSWLNAERWADEVATVVGPSDPWARAQWVGGR